MGIKIYSFEADKLKNPNRNQSSNKEKSTKTTIKKITIKEQENSNLPIQQKTFFVI